MLGELENHLMFGSLGDSRDDRDSRESLDARGFRDEYNEKAGPRRCHDAAPLLGS